MSQDVDDIDEISCADRAVLSAVRTLHSAWYWPTQAGLFVGCVLLLVWDVLRQHVVSRFASFDGAFSVLNWVVFTALVLDILVRFLARHRSADWDSCFSALDGAVLGLLVTVQVLMHSAVRQDLGTSPRRRNAWLAVIYACRYFAQVVRILLAWRAQSRGRETQRAACVEIPELSRDARPSWYYTMSSPGREPSLAASAAGSPGSNANQDSSPYLAFSYQHSPAF